MIKIALGFYLVLIIVTLVATIKDFDNCAITPVELYEINNFSMCAAIILYIIMFTMNPLFFLLHFIFWAFDKE